MKLDEYQKLAGRTINKELTWASLRNHALFGMCSEVGEIQSYFQKQYQGHEIDEHELMLEIGDCMWFIAELCTAFGWDLDEVGKANIDKLKKRYPEGFSEERSVHREEYE